MAILLSDAGLHRQLLPFTYTRPLGALRAGIFTIAEAWKQLSGLPVGFHTEAYLQGKFPPVLADRVFEVHGGWLPDPAVAAAVLDLEPGQVLMKSGKPLAFCLDGDARAEAPHWNSPPAYLAQVEHATDVHLVERPWHLFQHCGRAITNDMATLTAGRASRTLSTSNTVIGDPGLIFLEEGARVEASILNTTNGPIWIGEQAEVMEGCMIRGPFALGVHAQLKMGAKIYGPSAFGPECRVGGEVNNSVILGYSNKGHDGFLGNSVLGEWCNLGADTNTSNLKNTYGQVKAWSYATGALEPTGQQFLGLLMGDHAKSGINTMFNTGTVAGVCANVFGSGFPPKHIPPFSWGGTAAYALDKAMETCQLVMQRRAVALTADDRKILTQVFHLTESYRS
ncbi:MAG: glucose-1-phosphate thymidylyltransferase [Flavobacteriales bacterium]|nr:glucose-1-phosphate thymidylyltransferase [Flavobacteriales bacterium]